MTAQVHDGVLEARLSEMETARGWSPRVISRLESMIRTADDYDVFRINPIQYGAANGMDTKEAIDLFLHGTRLGLFEIEWHLVCAFCAHLVESLGQLSGVHSHFVCTFCRAENDVALDDYIQVTFTIAPQVRTVRYHQIDTLSIEEYYFKLQFAKGIQPLPNGLTFEQVAASITRHMQYVEPNERVVFEAEITPGMFQAQDLSHRASVAFFLREPHVEAESIRIDLEDGEFRATDRQLVPAEVQQPVARFLFDQTGELRSGKVRLEYTNRMKRRSPLLVLHFPAEFQSVPLSFDPFLSGKQLLTTQTFRSLFRTEALSADEGIAVKDITFLFTDLEGSTAMYERIGDLKAYYLVRQHFDTLITAIADNEGAIVKTIGDAVMATFMTPAAAVKAALEMLRRLDAFNRTISQDLRLKIGIHRGKSIAVTLNDRLDYFGQTVNIAARIQGLAGGSEIYISQEAHHSPEVESLLAGCRVTEEQATLKGVSGKVRVRKITL